MRKLTSETVMDAKHGDLFIVPAPGTGFPVSVICQDLGMHNKIYFTTLRCRSGQSVYETGEVTYHEFQDDTPYSDWSEHIRFDTPGLRQSAGGLREEFAKVLQSGDYVLG